MRALLVARNRFAEDKLAEAVQRGVKQYVVLGAGLDTFAHRNPHRDLRVFEMELSAFPLLEDLDAPTLNEHYFLDRPDRLSLRGRSANIVCAWR
jgi:hypothetical protein